MANLKQKFNKEMVPALQEKLGMKNVMAVPRLKKVVINMGVGQALTDKKHLTSACLLYTSPSPRDATLSRMPSSA